MQSLPRDAQVTDSNETILLAIRFKIAGPLRFLSHAQMLRVFQRACVRAGIDVRYSQGFNPRPRLSLPLPRSVGVESDDELLCIQVLKSARAQGHQSTANTHDLCTLVEARLAAQLPEGCELLSVRIVRPGTSFQPCSATYMLALRPEHLDDVLRATVEHLLTSESLNVQRSTYAGSSRLKAKDSEPKTVDVRSFLKSIEVGDRGIVVECKVSPSGSIRVEEILNLLEIDPRTLESPVRRTNVQWQVSES